jgi:hypothetical protein
MNGGGLAARAQRIGLGVVTILGCIDAWRYLRYQANPDGVSYVDLAIAFASQGPGALVNGYWSPLYPALIGVAYAVAPPGIETMYATAHLVGVLPFVAAALAYHHFLAALRREAGRHGADPGSEVLIVLVGWAAFALYVLKGIGLHLLTPDLGVAAVAFWLSAEALSLAAGEWPVARWVRAGVVLAGGYWWKAILFPVGLVWCGLAVIIAWRRDGRRGPIAGVATYAALSLVWIVPVSLHTGRATFGETGRLNYLWYVNAAPYVWERCLPASGTDPRAAPFGRIARDSLIAEPPVTCALVSPLTTATMPLWDDPSRYYREAHTRLDWTGQWRAVGNDVAALRKELGELGPASVAAAAALALALLASVPGAQRRGTTAALAGAGPVMLALFLAAPIAFYVVVYVEFRHVAPFVAAAVACVAAAAAIEWRARARVLLVPFAALALLEVAWRLSTPTLVAFTLARATAQGRAPDRVPVTHLVARALAASGLQPGTPVASINNAWNAEWAQLAGLRIRAVVPEWTTPIPVVLRELRDTCVRAAWDAALRRRGIAAAVARVPEGLAAPPGFERLAGTEFHLRRVPAAPEPCAMRPTSSSS